MLNDIIFVSKQAQGELEQLLEYKFNNVNLLIEALTHPSIKQIPNLKHFANYERLELLGDTILSFVITEFLFQNFIDYKEGELAKARASLVCKNTISKVALNINLAQYIIMTPGEVSSGGRSNLNNLENAMEALIAAIYLDSNLNSVRSVILDLWKLFLCNIDTLIADPKTALQEWAQKSGHATPIYELIGKTGAAHAPCFTVSVTALNQQQEGSGRTVKAAQKEAAQKALNLLNSIKIVSE